jgi:hypothetical protein
MIYRFLFALVLAVGLCFVPFAAAQGQAAPAATQAMPPASQAVPPELVLPSGTLVMVRLTDSLSSDRNRSGDGFTAVLDQPLVAQGWVVARRGQAVLGQVAATQKAGRVQGVSQLAVALNEFVLVDGRQVPVRTELVRSSAGTSRERDAVGVGTTTGIGAVVGAAAGGGEGAAIGAAAGAVAGIAGVLATRGRATELYPETPLTFRLQDPVTITTQEGQQAFRPVNQADYSGSDGRRNATQTHRAIEAYPPPPYYYPPYYYPGYPAYGFYGYGPTVFWGPRMFSGGRGYYRSRR